ncbi:MAG: DUF255 domain-containing protein [Bacteroidota bacterium]
MKKMLLVLLVLSMSSAALAKDLQWKKFNDGLAEAKRTGKKVLVDVYTDWCKWCKEMDKKTYPDKTISAYLQKHYVIIKLNAEGNEQINYQGQLISPQEFAQGMGVDGYPATVFLQSDGKPITLLPGYSTPDQFIHVLSYIGENHYLKKKFPDYLSEKGVK